MKLTKSKKEWVIKKVKCYCDLLQVVTPTILFTMAEYNRKKEEMRKQKKKKYVGRDNPYLYGVCHRDEYFIVILVKRHTSLNNMDNTIRHELLHLTKPSYNHKGKDFFDRMDRLKKGWIKNGRFYKPRGKR